MSGDDAGSTTSIKSGLLGNSQESKITGIPETRDPLNTNKALPREPTTGGLGSSTTTTGAHHSGLGDRADPRLDSERGLGSHGAATSTGGSVGSNLPDRSAGTTDPRVDSDRDGSRGLGTTSGYGLGTGATVGSAHQGDLNRSDAGAGISSGARSGEALPRGYGEESWSHEHLRHGHEFQGDPCEHEPPAPGAVHFIPGPHSLDTANRLDPHVSGGGPLESASTSGGPTSHTGHHHEGRDAAMGAGLGAGVGAGAYQTSRDAPATSSSHPGATAAGPHRSDALNKADPRVDSDLSRQQASTSTPGRTEASSTSTTGPTSGREHHLGRDAAFAGAGGAGPAGLHEAGQHRGQGVSEDTSTSGYANPYPPTSTAKGTDSANTSTTATGIGAGPSTGSTRPLDPTSTGKDHHYGRDAALVGGGAGAAYEADKHLRGAHSDTTGPRTDSANTSTTATGLGAGPTTGSTRPLDPTSTSKDHYGRDAALVGGGAGAAYEADKHLRGPHSDTTGPRTMDPLSTHQVSPGTYDSRHEPSATTGSAGYVPSRDDNRDRTHDHHADRDIAVGAGAGAAAVGVGEELSRKDLEHERELAHKQELKDEKAAHKHELKDEKHHQHELDKERKAHEKAMAKEEAKHEKDDLKHHKREEAPVGEKKHHGLFGFLHRDKPDKELKEDELARKEREEGSHHPGVGTTAGTAAGLSELEKHQLAKEQDRNRLHKDPPPGFGETEYAEAPKTGYASQVTGGTGTTALAQGEPVARGSHITNLGNNADPNVASRGDTVDSDKTRDAQGRIVEPHTGLPIDLSKGDGAGGTDSTPVHGYHS
ncbi:MAG: hypothetical protein LQ350_005585 [Teloschistes chrysophthalmus]|nr:MAG: hypothetical protein LQ350_005585 [Niorma chrysophthalma]